MSAVGNVVVKGAEILHLPNHVWATLNKVVRHKDLVDAYCSI